MAIRIRPAKCEDAEFLAWNMLTASRGHLRRGIWDVIVGADEAGCLEYLKRLALTEPRSLCHYVNCLVAEVNDHPAAAICGFEMGAGGWTTFAEAMSNVHKDLGWTEADLTALRQRLVPVWSCFMPEIGADWRIYYVATIVEYRRRGLANLLVNEMIREGINRRCKLAQIEILIGNNAAQAT